MVSERRCSECGRSLDGLMATHEDQPGLGGLLRGEGEDRLLILCARVFALLLIFASALGVFAAIAAGITAITGGMP